MSNIKAGLVAGFSATAVLSAMMVSYSPILGQVSGLFKRQPAPADQVGLALLRKSREGFIS